ncbi:hypothetical protein Trydic_g6449 [Trypoxylus dichotomus]
MAMGFMRPNMNIKGYMDVRINDEASIATAKARALKHAIGCVAIMDPEYSKQNATDPREKYQIHLEKEFVTMVPTLYPSSKDLHYAPVHQKDIQPAEVEIDTVNPIYDGGNPFRKNDTNSCSSH